MKFSDRITNFQLAKKHPEIFGKTGELIVEMADKLSPQMRLELLMEAAWEKARRPYYNVYPGIVDSFLRLRLDIPGSVIRLPVNPLLIRFSEEKPFCRHLRNILVMEKDFTNSDGTDYRGLGVWCDMVETQTYFGLETPMKTWGLLTLDTNNLEETLHYIAENHQHTDFPQTEEEKGLVKEAMKIVVALSMLSEEDSLLEPDVLSKDQQKWERTKDPAIVERAHRRGKKGWTVGKKLEVSPHVRRPHFGIRWTGPGRKIPRLRPIKGSVIHRKRVSEVPTGYSQGDQDV